MEKHYLYTPLILFLIFGQSLGYLACPYCPSSPNPPPVRPPTVPKPSVLPINPPHIPKPPVIPRHPVEPIRPNPPPSSVPCPPPSPPPLINLKPPIVPKPPAEPKPPVVPVTPSIPNPPQTPVPCPPPPRLPPSCPIDALKLSACVDVLGGLIHIGIGSGQDTCCPVLDGLVGLDAALCLCTTIRAKLLNVNLVLPIALQALVDCGKTPPPGFHCPAS